MRTMLGMRLTARWKTRARRPSPRSMRTRPGPPRANQRAPARPRGGEGEIVSLTSLKLKAAHKRHLRRGQAGPRPGEAGAEGDYNGGRRQGGGTFRGRMYLDDTRQPPRGTRRFPGERGSEPQDAPRLARSAENTRDRHPAALAAEGLGTAVARGGRQGAPRGVDAATGTSGTFAGREARGAAALQGGGVGGFRRGDPPPRASTRPPRVSGGGRDAHDRPLHSRPAGSPRLAWESDFIAGVRAGNRGTRFGAVRGPPSPRVRGAGSPPTRARPRKRRRRARGHVGARRGGAAVPAAPPHGPGPRGEAPRTERGPGTRAKRTRRPRSRVTEGRRGRERAARQHAVASRVSWVRVARGTARGRRKWPRRKPGLGAACALG